MVTQQVMAGPDVGRVISRAVRSLRELDAVPVSFGGHVATNQRSFVITDLAGTMTQSLLRLRVSAEMGLGGKALALLRPVTVHDYLNAQGITHRYDQAVSPEQLYAVMAVPIKVDNVARAVLYVASRERMPFGERLINRIGPILQRAEQDIMVEERVYRRLTAIAREAAERRRVRTPGPDASAVYAELSAITESISDDTVREQLRAVCDRILELSTADVPAVALRAVKLSPREREVLSYVAIGYTNDQVAVELGLLPNTVKAYVKTAIRKLDAGNRTHAAHLAREAGLITIPRQSRQH